MKMDISNVIIGKRVFFRKCVCMMFMATVIIIVWCGKQLD